MPLETNLGHNGLAPASKGARQTADSFRAGRVHDIRFNDFVNDAYDTTTGKKLQLLSFKKTENANGVKSSENGSILSCQFWGGRTSAE